MVQLDTIFDSSRVGPRLPIGGGRAGRQPGEPTDPALYFGEDRADIRIPPASVVASTPQDIEATQRLVTYVLGARDRIRETIRHKIDEGVEEARLDALRTAERRAQILLDRAT